MQRNVFAGSEFLLYDIENNPIALSRNCALKVNQKLADITTKDSQSWTDLMPTLKDWSIEFEGLVSYGSGFTFSYFYQKYQDKEPFFIRFGIIQDDFEHTFYGEVAIESINQSASMDDVATFDGSLKGIGNLSFTNEGTPEQNGYLKVESDPVFRGSPAFGITNDIKNKWNESYDKTLTEVEFVQSGNTTTLKTHLRDGSIYSSSFINLGGSGSSINNLSFNTGNGTLTVGSLTTSLDGRYQAIGDYVGLSYLGNNFYNKLESDNNYYPANNPNGFISGDYNGFSLTSHTHHTLTGLTVNDYLTIPNQSSDVINSIWISDVIGSTGYTPSIVTNMNDLSDVNLLAPSNGQALVYQSGLWVNQNIVTDITNYWNKSESDSRYYPLTNNPANYLTSASTLPWNSVTGKPSFFDGNYNSLSNKPTSLSQFTNNLGNYGNWITQAQGNTFYSLLGHTHSYSEITGKPTNLSQFTNDLGNYGNWITKAQGDTYYPAISGYNKSNWDTAYSWGNHNSVGYLTSESDTLDSVVQRGASTNANVSFNGSLVIPSTNSNQINSIWISDTIGSTGYTPSIVVNLNDLSDVNITSASSGQALVFNGSTWTNQSVVTDLSNYYTKAQSDSNYPSITGYNKSNWDTVFGWGNHASAGYANTQYVINNFAYKNGSNASGTWGINISGNAASATNSQYWSGIDFTATLEDTAPTGILGYYNTGVTVRRTTPTGLQSFLGIPSGGETLQSITDRGNSTSTTLYLDSLNGNALFFRTDGTPTALLSNNFNIDGVSTKTDFNTYVYGNNPYSIWTNSAKRFTVFGNGDASFSGSVGIGGILGVDGNITISKGVPELVLNGTQAGGRNYSLVSGIIGVANAGFSVRDNTSGTNPFYIDGSGNAGFTGSVTAPTFIGDLDGNATNATQWGGRTANLSTYQNDPASLFLTVNPTGGAVNISNVGHVQGILGLQSGAYKTINSTVLGTGYAPDRMYVGLGEAGVLHPMNVSGIQQFLGLGSNAYQSFDNFHYETFTADANTLPSNRSAFTYANNAPYTGPITHFGADGYGLQLNASYGDGGYYLAFRTRNGDGGYGWNSWRRLLTDTDLANETFESVTNRGNNINQSISIGGSGVNSNGTKLFIKNGFGSTWALSSGANNITENGFHIYDWTNESSYPSFSIINGNVGIATASPSEKLTVAGNIYASGDLMSDATVTAPNLYANRAILRQSGISLGSGNSAQLEIGNAGSGACNISFHREGAYGAHFGLDTDNWFSTFGWSAGGGYTSMRVGSFNSLGDGYFSGALTVVGTVSGSRGIFGADSGAAGSVNATGWFRSFGASGWFNQTYEGGIYMEDSTWVRVYNGKKLRAENDIVSATKLEAPKANFSTELIIPTVASSTIGAIWLA